MRVGAGKLSLNAELVKHNMLIVNCVRYTKKTDGSQPSLLHGTKQNRLPEQIWSHTKWKTADWREVVCLTVI